MAKKKGPVHPNARKLMRKLKVGQCYWVVYTGLVVITKIQESTREDGSVVVETAMLEVMSPDGSVRTQVRQHGISTEDDIKRFGKRADQKKLLATYTKLWKKIYQPKK
jgi:hypothetical protein